MSGGSSESTQHNTTTIMQRQPLRWVIFPDLHRMTLTGSSASSSQKAQSLAILTNRDWLAQTLSPKLITKERSVTFGVPGVGCSFLQIPSEVKRGVGTHGATPHLQTQLPETTVFKFYNHTTPPIQVALFSHLYQHIFVSIASTSANRGLASFPPVWISNNHCRSGPRFSMPL